MDYRSRGSEPERRDRRYRGEDRWSRRGDNEREPIDPFEGHGEQEEWEFEPRNRAARWERGFEQLEDWQQPRQFRRSGDEGRRGQRSFQGSRRTDELSHGPGQTYGEYGQRYGASASRHAARAWDLRSSESERFGTRQPFGSGEYRGSQGNGGHGLYSGKGPKGYRRSDERIQEELSDRLTADPDIDASEMTVTVRQGEVTLEGSVCERSMKHAAEDLAEEISGVSEVHNRLRVERREDGQGAERSSTSSSSHMQTSGSQSQVGGTHSSAATMRGGEKR